MPFLKCEDDSTLIEVEPSREADSESEPQYSQTPQKAKTPAAQRAKTPVAQPQNLAKGRAKRTHKVPARFSDYEMAYFALCVAESIEFDEPATYEEAMKGKEWKQWLEAMKEEMESLLKNGTWILVDRPDSKKPVGCKWIFKKKVEVYEGDRIRYKARLVAKGYSQREGVDFNEIFSPVVKHASIRILLSVVTHRDWELHQLDVKTAFLHGELEETIFMEQPVGFVVSGQENNVCQLKKSLYD